MPRRLVKDHAAEEDLIGIWLYSHRNWGQAQADRYMNAIEAGMKVILKAPDEGLNLEHIRRGYWSTRVQHHVAFYTFNSRELRIRRVLHEVMDPERNL
ncbi:MAG: toxin ParE1/3/4 [Planctomycetota bacterium]|jgi:toxin ParE1/3/4